jgi:hypothetical protein
VKKLENEIQKFKDNIEKLKSGKQDPTPKQKQEDMEKHDEKLPADPPKKHNE